MALQLSLADLSMCGAHQRGHFKLSSGLHSSDYLQCAIYFAQPRRAAQAGHILANAIKASLVTPDLIVSPAIGGLIIGHETARSLDVPFLFTERVDGEMRLRRGFAIAHDQAVIVVEDVVTTGGSCREVIEVVEGLGGYVLGVASLVDRSGESEPFGSTPFRSLLEADFPIWEADECPLCRQGKAIDKPGSRPFK